MLDKNTLLYVITIRSCIFFIAKQAYIKLKRYARIYDKLHNFTVIKKNSATYQRENPHLCMK